MDGLHTELALGLIGFGGAHQLQAPAPFVAKTYQMVCDPRTDALVRWGRENNSFVVVDPAGFSQLLLPCFFKHSNFSSFVRQLNTYGFRKVHPDRWEFAHESFLRGQTHLLPRIVRRKKLGEGGGGAASSCFTAGVEEERHHHHHLVEGHDDDEESREALVEELQRLRQEQAAIGEELAQMSRRLQATERRPDQLMSFLARLAEDPDGVTRSLVEQAAEKKRRRLLQNNNSSAHPVVVSPLPAPPPPPLALCGAARMDCDDDDWRWMDQKPATTILPSFDPTASSREVPDFAAADVGDDGTGLLTTHHDAAVEPPFPFCLLGQGFF